MKVSEERLAALEARTARLESRVERLDGSTERPRRLPELRTAAVESGGAEHIPARASEAPGAPPCAVPFRRLPRLPRGSRTSWAGACSAGSAHWPCSWGCSSSS